MALVRNDCLGGWSSPGSLGPPAPALSITVKDLTPKFLTFYRAAPRQRLRQRFKLWKRLRFCRFREPQGT